MNKNTQPIFASNKFGDNSVVAMEDAKQTPRRCSHEKGAFHNNMEPFSRSMEKVHYLVNSTEKNQTKGIELIDVLDEVEKIYEQLQQITSASHKAENFSIAIFGSARLPENSPEFEFVSKLTQSLVKQIPVDIATGGGPGIMEAANQGAMNAVKGKESDIKTGKKPTIYGMSIRLPFEEKPSPHIHINKLHEHFTTRLQSFVSLIQGAYVDAGGIGSLLEMSLLWQLKQVNHLPAEFPLVVSPVWKPMLEMFYHMTFTHRKNSVPLISPDNMQLIQFSDDIDEIVEIFRTAHQQWQGVRSTSAGLKAC